MFNVSLSICFIRVVDKVFKICDTPVDGSTIVHHYYVIIIANLSQ